MSVHTWTPVAVMLLLVSWIGGGIVLGAIGDQHGAWPMAVFPFTVCGTVAGLFLIGQPRVCRHH